MRRIIPAAAVGFYAVSYPIGALAVSAVSPFTLIAVRFGLTALLLWSCVGLSRLASGERGRALLPRGRRLGWAVLAGLLVHGVQFLGVYWALANGVGPGICALVIAMNPLATSLLGRLVAGSGPENHWGYVALAAGAMGVLTACAPRIIADPRLGAGAIVAVLALLGLAAGSLIQSRRLTGLNAVVFTAIGTTASLPAAVLLALAEHATIADPSRAGILIGALVVTSALATSLYAACVRRSGARRASILFAVIPGVAALASWLIQGSPIGIWTLVGLALGAFACAAQARAARGDASSDSREPAEPPRVTIER